MDYDRCTGLQSATNLVAHATKISSLYGRLLSPIRDRAQGVSLPLIGCRPFHCSNCEFKKCDRPEQAERQSCLNETEKKINTTKRVKMKWGRNIESFFIKKSSQDTGDGPWEDANWPRSFGDSIIDSEPEETTESEIEPGPETQIKKPKMYSFRHDWLTQFSWLRYEKGRNAMHCIYCRECGQNMAGNSAFVSGSTTFRIETLTSHSCPSSLTATQTSLPKSVIGYSRILRKGRPVNILIV